MPDTMKYDLYDASAPLFIEKAGALGRLYFNRPDKFNAMSFLMWRELPRYLAALDDDPSIRVLIIAGKGGRAFSAGADVREMARIVEDLEWREENRLAIRNAQRSLARTKKPTIAKIDGLCIGGGCGLAIHCDLRVASDVSKFAITPAKLGLVYPLNDTKELVDLVGPARAKKLLFSANQIGADEALRIGLIDEVHSVTELDGAVGALAARIADLSQFSIQKMKLNIQAILDGQTDDDAATSQLFTDAHDGDDAKEGMQAFAEKRAPKFEWNG